MIKEGTDWIETRTDIEIRMDAIKQKIKEMTPDLYMKSDIDYNFIDKITSREEEKEAYKKHKPLISNEIDSSDEEDI